LKCVQKMRDFEELNVSKPAKTRSEGPALLAARLLRRRCARN
jgi:hypothetical protein